MSDRTPEHRRTAPGQLGANTDPSNPGTCETPLPVSYVEDGGNASERSNAGRETGLPGEGCCDLHKDGCCDLDDCGPCCESCPTCPAASEGLISLKYYREVVAGYKGQTARADAAEAKLARTEKFMRHEHERATKATIERDEARGKLAELDKGIRDALHGLESDLGDDATLPARVDELHESYLDATRAGGVYLAEREKAVGKLNQVRAAVEEWGPGLYDRLVALIEPVTDREEPAQAPEISGAGVPFEQSTGPKRDQCGASSPNGRKQCIRHRGHAGEHMSSVIDTQWASEEPAGETNPDDEHADDCTGCNGPGIVPCAADEVIGRFAYRNGECIKDLEARFGEGLEVVERQADSEAQR